MTGWLEISTEGFASFNSSRKPGHLVKELVQNAFDAIGDKPGDVYLDYQHNGREFIVECRDTGEGMLDLEAIRVVYLTFKKDSHLKRGRFGRGFKEVLSIASWAIVESGNNGLHFTVENGKQIAKSVTLQPPITGTVVRMALPFSEEAAAELDAYFGAFLVPRHISFYLNGRVVGLREPKHVVEVSLTTEVYHGESHSWRKPKRAAQIELVPTRQPEEAMIYEMGIPVADAEWAVPFHVNVLQRVPMNPNRDALASGYVKSVHAAALPVLLPDLDETEATQDWVGTAGVACDEDVQKAIVTKAFGTEAVRFVPTMGKRDFNDDAERVGAVIVRTNQMSSGFREMAKVHLPTAKEKVDEVQTKLVEAVAQSGFSLKDDLGIEAEAKLAW
ncbi:MAG: ATP-binding protein, partial [Verrucomicrobiales bacterium]